MALTAVVNVAVTPITLTVTSDARRVSVAVTTGGETATGTATFPVKLVDVDRTWTLKTDTGLVAVYTA